MRNLAILLFGLIFSSCSSVHFVSPVPPGGEALSEFPKELRGSFSADDDRIFVKDEFYVYQSKSQKKIAEQNIQTHEKYLMIKDKIYNREYPGEGIDFEIKDGNIEFVEINNDTSYINKNFILIESGIYYYLNLLDEEEKDYIVFRASLIPIGIKLESINLDDDHEELLNELREICDFKPMGEEGNDYKVDPSSSEFKKLIAKGIFNSESELKRLSK